MLEQTMRLVEQNNRLLRKINRSMFWSSIFQILYWLFIIAVAVGAFYAVQPYLGMIGPLLTKAAQLTNIPALSKF